MFRLLRYSPFSRAKQGLKLKQIIILYNMNIFYTQSFMTFFPGTSEKHFYVLHLLYSYNYKVFRIYLIQKNEIPEFVHHSYAYQLETLYPDIPHSFQTRRSDQYKLEQR